MPFDIVTRLATPADLPVLGKLIEASVRKLQAQDYSAPQMEAALQTVFGVDSQLIADGTYFVAEAASPGVSSDRRAGASLVLAGCGGWSKRKTLYGGDQWRERQDDLLDSKTDAAKVRAFFVHPDWARCGVASAILDACENAAREAGFTRFEMGATLTGEKFFRERGYVAQERIELSLQSGITLPIVHMVKTDPPGHSRSAKY
ncbi:MAG TPA: GNAT family N-acetyltransferase [Candidatus Angelobacter sp.]|nr:GNAT family N-acetyltransferase [Candidatus Angelobacter sp.]